MDSQSRASFSNTINKLASEQQHKNKSELTYSKDNYKRDYQKISKRNYILSFD